MKTKPNPDTHSNLNSTPEDPLVTAYLAAVTAERLAVEAWSAVVKRRMSFQG